MKDNGTGDFQATPFPGTQTGLQAAIDYLGGAKGKVSIGPGTLTLTNAISIHGGCHLEGCGKGVTILQRAAGALSAGDPFYSGNLLLTTKFGANGTPNFALADAQTDIIVSDLTLDGNSQTMGATAPGNPRHMGIYATYTNKFLVRDVEIKNFLQSGIQFDSCGNVLVTGCHIHEVGQYAGASARNGISVINNQAAAYPYGHNCVITKCFIQNVNDTSVDFANVSDCQYTDTIVENPGSLCVEFESDSTKSAVMSNITIARIMVTGLYTNFVSIPAHPGVTISDIKILDNTINCINQGALMGGVFLNATDATTSFIRSVLIRGNTIRWDVLSGSGNIAINLTGNVSDVQIKDNFLQNVPGVGIQLASQVANAVIQDIEIVGNVVDQCTNFGITLFFGSGLDSTIRRVTIANNVVIDAAQTVNNAAIGLTQAQNSAGQVMQDIHVHGNKAYRIAGVGTFNYGIRFFQNGAGTLDRVFIAHNVFKNMAVAPMGIDSGTPTNLSLAIPPGRGTNVTAAATITLPHDGDIIHVTGNTNITNGITVKPWDNGRRVTLVFEGTPTVSDTGTSKLAGNFVAAGTTNDFDTLSLACDGTNWYEVARSVN